MGRKLKAAIAGLGSRGKDAYVVATRLFPDKMEIALIADTDPAKVLKQPENIMCRRKPVLPAQRRCLRRIGWRML